jgi:hypothetical protein
VPSRVRRGASTSISRGGSGGSKVTSGVPRGFEDDADAPWGAHDPSLWADGEDGDDADDYYDTGQGT